MKSTKYYQISRVSSPPTFAEHTASSTKSLTHTNYSADVDFEQGDEHTSAEQLRNLKWTNIPKKTEFRSCKIKRISFSLLIEKIPNFFR